MQSHTLTSVLYTARQKSKKYALTPYECVHRTRLPHLICSRNNGPRGKGPRGSRGKSGTQRLLASAPFVRCQFSICHDNIGKILRVALSQLDKRGISEGAGKLHEHYFFECVIATINDRQYSSCGNRVDLELPSSASTSRQSPLFFQTDRFMHTGSTVSLGRLSLSRPIQSSFQTSVPKTLAESPSDVMARYIHG